MIELFGDELVIIGIIPGIFGALLSLYNYFKSIKPASIIPTEIVNYGLISSSYEEAYKFVLPLVFHNEGARNGIIKQIKIGFKHGDEIKYLDITGKAKLAELQDKESEYSNWEKYTEHGYKLLQPSYPITVLANSSTDVMLIATCSYEENVFPLDIESKLVIEVYYGSKGMKTIEFPFFLSKNDIPDNRLYWFTPVAKNVFS